MKQIATKWWRKWRRKEKFNTGQGWWIIKIWYNHKADSKVKFSTEYINYYVLVINSRYLRDVQPQLKNYENIMAFFEMYIYGKKCQVLLSADMTSGTGALKRFDSRQILSTIGRF